MGRGRWRWYRDFSFLRSFLWLSETIKSELRAFGGCSSSCNSSFFICRSVGSRKQDLPEQGMRCTVLGQLIWGSFQTHGNWAESLHLFLLEAVRVCVHCSHFSAPAGMNGLKLLSVFCSKSCIRFSTAELKPMIHNQFRLQNVLLIDRTETNFSVGNWTLRKLITRQAKPISFGPGTAYCMLLRDDLAVERKAML